jgi:hypothetical protein
MASYLYSGRNILAMSNYLELDAQSRTALDRAVREIRRAKCVTGFTTNSISFRDYDDQSLQLTWNPATKQLTSVRTVNKKDPETKVLLEGCDGLTFTMMAREPNDGTWNLNSTTDTNQCKAVFITWNCSRKFIDTKLNTESMTSATVVLRNK